jgi:hypothetical protein
MGVEDTAEHLSEELVVAMVVVLDQQAVARTIECLQDVPQNLLRVRWRLA